MFSIKDISDKQGLSKNPSTNATEHEISANINTKEGKKKEDEDFDKCWDEYDDQDEDDLSEEDIEKKDSNANNNNYYYSKQNYKYSKSYDYYGYKNNYSYGEKKYKKKKGGHKYQYDGYSNKNYQKHYTKDQGEYNYQNNNFMNTNSNYMRKPGSEYYNKYSNNNTYKNKTIQDQWFIDKIGFKPTDDMIEIKMFEKFLMEKIFKERKRERGKEVIIDYGVNRIDLCYKSEEIIELQKKLDEVNNKINKIDFDPTIKAENDKRQLEGTERNFYDYLLPVCPFTSCPKIQSLKDIEKEKFFIN